MRNTKSTIISLYPTSVRKLLNTIAEFCSDYYTTISIEKKLKTPSIKNLNKHTNISNSYAQYAQHPSQVFTKVPHVYVTSVHTQAITNNQRDASSVWAEEVTTASFKICLRELKNFDGVHRHLRVVNFQQHKTSLKPRTKLSYTNTLGGKRGGGVIKPFYF